MRKFLLTFAAIAMAMSAMAANRLYLGNVSVLKEHLGDTIIVPVYMDCDAYVSGWQFDLILPDGMTLVGSNRGTDLYVPYIDDFGDPDTLQATFASREHLDWDPPCTRFLSVIMQQGCEYNEETGDYETYGVVKWGPADSLEMAILHIAVSEDFAGGNIGMAYMLSSGKDTRGPIVNDQPDAAGCLEDPDYASNPVTVVDVKPDTKCAVPTILSLDSEGNPLPAGEIWYETELNEDGQEVGKGVTVTFVDNCDSEMCDGNCVIKYALIRYRGMTLDAEKLYTGVWHVWDGKTPFHFTVDQLNSGKYNSYYVFARCMCKGMECSDVAIQTITFNQVKTSVDELNADKTVATERYFNVAGQEISEPDGLTIVLTTYTDGTTSASKVVK